jgi:hypothetical protein
MPLEEVNMDTAIHILKHGSAMCGLRGTPSSWPDGNLWVSFKDLDNLPKVTCKACLDANSVRPK